jgi:hypothetical protein
MNDPMEQLRWARLVEINASPADRETLAARHLPGPSQPPADGRGLHPPARRPARYHLWQDRGANAEAVSSS